MLAYIFYMLIIGMIFVGATFGFYLWRQRADEWNRVHHKGRYRKRR
jgi:hypothetical protein